MPSGLERWTGDRTVEGSNPTAENSSIWNFANSVYSALPVSHSWRIQQISCGTMSPIFFIFFSCSTLQCKLLHQVSALHHEKYFLIFKLCR